VRLADMHDFAAPETLALLRRVEVVADPARARYCPAITVTLTDGRRLAAEENEGADAFALDWAAAARMSATLCEEAGVAAALQSRLAEVSDGLPAAPLLGSLVQAICACTASLRPVAATAVAA
jgi:hypothetical protein